MICIPFGNFLKHSQGLEGEYLYYHVLGLNEYSTEDDMKKIYQKLARQSHLGGEKHPQDSDVMRMINKAKEGSRLLLPKSCRSKQARI